MTWTPSGPGRWTRRRGAFLDELLLVGDYLTCWRWRDGRPVGEVALSCTAAAIGAGTPAPIGQALASGGSNATGSPGKPSVS